MQRRRGSTAGRRLRGERPATGRRFVAVGLLPAFLAGCYTYEPLMNPEPPMGQDVRVRYTGDEVAGIRWQVRDGTAYVVEGKVIEWASDAAVLSVPPLPSLDPNRRYQTPDTIFIPISRISYVEQKDLNWGRTILFVGGVAVGASILGATLLNWVRGGGVITDTGPPIPAAPGR